MPKTRLTSSELWSLYPNAKPINSNPIVSKEERYRKIDAAERLQRKNLGRHGAKIGLYLGIPVVLTVAAARTITSLLTSIQPNDTGTAMFAVFSSFAIASIVILVSRAIYKEVDELFTKHLFNGRPVILLTVINISVIAWGVFTITGNSLQATIVGLVATLIAGTLVTIPLMLVCASRISANAKVAALLLATIGLLAGGFIITLNY